mmetsp:Transcript_91190/g.203587  ORF Transcript_91190/g.203587 Transcript_91190/m.203587 type:complete len:293 (+) Transcript_91190:677-1555(+)
MCRRRRKTGADAGCGKGVCWACMESRPRSELGMVRTSKEEFEGLEGDAWWMHEFCMEAADLRSYFGSEKEVALARAAADEAEAAEAEVQAKASGSTSGKKHKVEVQADPKEEAKAKIRAMSVKELKAYLDRQKADHSNCVEKADLLAAALKVADTAPPPPPKGPAWMPVGMICRLCTKPVKQERAGVICRRHRPDGSIGGCGEGVCWRCMKRAGKDTFGHVRTTKEEFESLEEDAWWMHYGCFEGSDYKDYFGESEPEDEVSKKNGAWEEWDEGGGDSRASLGSIMRRCEAG